MSMFTGTSISTSPSVLEERLGSFISTSPSVLEERLGSFRLCEIHKNGKSSHSTMTLRDLHNYVVKNIVEACVEEEEEEEESTAETEHAQDSPSRKITRTTWDRPSICSSRETKLNIDIGRGNVRFGTYLHPRDTRQLMAPFFTSDEPIFAVRRHVIFMKFDPVRAVVLHDRVLLLRHHLTSITDTHQFRKVMSTFDGLEKRLKGIDLVTVSDEVFGPEECELVHPTAAGSCMFYGTGSEGKEVLGSAVAVKERVNAIGSKVKEGVIDLGAQLLPNRRSHEEIKKEEKEAAGVEKEERQFFYYDYNIAFELRAIDIILQTVTDIMKKEARVIAHHSKQVLDGIKQTDYSTHEEVMLAMHRYEIDVMESRVNNFMSALQKICDDEKQLALMNLSRLLTHPQRFVNPTNDILLEESEEAELLVDCHLWEGTVLANELKLLGKEADRSEKDLSIHLDSLRNRLLYINTLVTVAGLVVAVGSLIAGIFGVNTPFVLMNDPTAFRRIWIPTALLMILSFILLSRWLYLASTSDASWKKIVLKGTFNKIRK